MRAQKAQDDDEWQAGDEDYYDDDYEQSNQHKPRYAKKRTLNRWNVDQDQYILLALVEVCGFQGLELPWAQVGQQCDPVLTEQSIKQHLAKTRTVRERSGFPCPPRLERARVITKRVTNRKPTGASLLPPPEQNRKNKKRGNTSIEPVEPPKKRSRASTAPEVEQLKPIGPLNAISGFHVGSAQHETYLCNEADNFSNITAATRPQSVDFMGSSCAFDFDPKRYEGTTLDLHQSMVYDAADRLMQANHYPGDEQVRAAAKKAGLGSDAQERFEIKQLQCPVNYAPPAKAAAREPAPVPKAPVAPMYAGQNASTGNLQSTAVHMDVALPRSLTWPSLSGGQPAVATDDHKANSAPIPQLNWSPSENHYIPSSQAVSAPVDLDAFLASALRKHTGAGYALYSGMTGLVTPPSDSLNASQLATPMLSLNNSQHLGIDHGPSLDHVKVDGHSDLKDEDIPATYDFGSFVDDHSQPVNDDGVFNDLVQFDDGEHIFNDMATHNPCDPLTWG